MERESVPADMAVKIEAVLADRERRGQLGIELAEQMKLTVVCARINYPGFHKNTASAIAGFAVLREAIQANFENEIIHTTLHEGADGHALILALEGRAEDIKKRAVLMEEDHPIGRLFDLDVISSQGTGLGRSDLGLPERKCYMCGQAARACASRQKHDLECLIDHCNRQISAFIQPSSAGWSHEKLPPPRS